MNLHARLLKSITNPYRLSINELGVYVCYKVNKGLQFNYTTMSQELARIEFCMNRLVFALIIGILYITGCIVLSEGVFIKNPLIPIRSQRIIALYASNFRDLLNRSRVSHKIFINLSGDIYGYCNKKVLKTASILNHPITYQEESDLSWCSLAFLAGLNPNGEDFDQKFKFCSKVVGPELQKWLAREVQQSELIIY